MTADISLPVAALVSKWLIAGDRQHPERHLLGVQVCDDRQQVANGPRKPIQLGDSETVAFAHVIVGRATDHRPRLARLAK